MPLFKLPALFEHLSPLSSPAVSLLSVPTIKLPQLQFTIAAAALAAAAEVAMLLKTGFNSTGMGAARATVAGQGLR
jgi:hypothetical protein